MSLITEQECGTETESNASTASTVIIDWETDTEDDEEHVDNLDGVRGTLDALVNHIDDTYHPVDSDYEPESDSDSDSDSGPLNSDEIDEKIKDGEAFSRFLIYKEANDDPEWMLGLILTARAEYQDWSGTPFISMKPRHVYTEALRDMTKYVYRNMPEVFDSYARFMIVGKANRKKKRIII